MKGMRLVGFIVALTITTAVYADFMNADFSQPIKEATQWIAGQDQLNTWYGANYSVEDHTAQLNYVSQSTKQSAARSLVQVLAIPDAGNYSWSFENQLTEYNNQWCYWQVYLLKDNAIIDLVGGPSYNKNIGNGKLISSDYARDSDDGGKWVSYTDNFTIDKNQAKNYNYIAFVMTGSIYSPSQVLGFGNFYTTVPGAGSIPEPATLILLSMGVVAMVKRKRWMC
jgi:hypothetical protein